MAEIAKPNRELDAIDRQIVALLQEDARRTNATIAERVGLTASSVFERVRKLERRGVIRGYRADVDPAAVGRPLLGFLRITASAVGGADYVAARARLAEACAADPDVLECHSVAGTEGYLLKIRVPDPAALEALVARLRANELVANTTTNIVLTTFKETACLAPVAAEPAR